MRKSEAGEAALALIMNGTANGNLYVWVNDDVLKQSAASALSGSVTDEPDAKGNAPYLPYSHISRTQV